MTTKIKIQDLQKKSSSQIMTPFWLSLPINKKVLHQVTVYFQNLNKSSTAHAKTRGQIRGGGKKPWKQKGTGRARAGSLRSPIFRGGGVIFGPTSAINKTKRLPDKIRRKALFIGFSSKFIDQKLDIIKPIQLSQINTKNFAKIFDSKIKDSKNLLFLDLNPDEKIIKSARNLKDFNLKDVRFINLLDILKSDLVILSKNAFDYLDKKAITQIKKEKT